MVDDQANTVMPQARFAVCVLEDHERRILLLKRSTSAGLGPGLWAFPAGHIEAGETPLACAERELSEEIGTPVLRLRTHVGPVRDSFYGGIYKIFLFHYFYLGGALRLNHEHTAFAWVGPDDYRTYAVMDGVDEDLAYLQVWPRPWLNQAKLPIALRAETP
jgi:8-oxo-dGTP pyrophosphatase MutT (NUDIX family)